MKIIKIQRIREIFDSSPINIHLEVPEDEIHKISDHFDIVAPRNTEILIQESTGNRVWS